MHMILMVKICNILEIMFVGSLDNNRNRFYDLKG